MSLHCKLSFPNGGNLVQQEVTGIQLPLPTYPQVKDLLMAHPSSILFLLSVDTFRSGMALSCVSPDVTETKIRKKVKLGK